MASKRYLTRSGKQREMDQRHGLLRSGKQREMVQSNDLLRSGKQREMVQRHGLLRSGKQREMDQRHGLLRSGKQREMDQRHGLLRSGKQREMDQRHGLLWSGKQREMDQRHGLFDATLQPVVQLHRIRRGCGVLSEECGVHGASKFTEDHPGVEKERLTETDRAQKTLPPVFKSTTGKDLTPSREMASKRYLARSEEQQEMDLRLGLFDAKLQPVVKLYRIVSDQSEPEEYFLEECEVHGAPTFIDDQPGVEKGETDVAKKTLPPGFESTTGGDLTPSGEMASITYLARSEEQREMDQGHGLCYPTLQPVVKLYRIVSDQSEPDEYFLEECEVHGAPTFIDDQPGVEKGETDRARKTLPPGFEIRKSRIRGAGLGVFYCGQSKLPAGTHFGPYEGVKTVKEEAEKSGYSWVIRRERDHYDYIDAKDETWSNWMRYVNCARHEKEQNLIAFQHGGGVWYCCFRPVARGEELLVWYGDEYAKELGIVFDEMWNNKSTAKGVLRRSPQTELFSCSACPYSFTSQGYLNKHLKRSHNDVYCQTLMSDHITSAAACQPTNGSVTRKKPGDTDPQFVPTGEKPFQCSQCDKCFRRPQYLKQHQRFAHTGEKTFQCSHCDKCFNRSGHLEAHQLVHTGEKPFQCTHCDQSFNQSQNLKKHQLVHTGEKPFKCTHCDKTFSLLGSLNRHRLVHTTEQPFQCTYCGKRFNLSSSLKRHQLVHTVEKTFQCSHCDKCFNRPSHLEAHQLVHTGEKPFQCKHCDQSFNQSQNLKKHQLVHTGEKSFKCTHCDKTFSLLGSLNRHRVVHTAEQPFQCTYCGKRFNLSSSLRRHQLVHTGEKTFQCTHCGKKFSLLDDLNKHQLVHTVAKRFQCTHCDQGFNSLAHMKRHQLVHTGEKPFRCKHCDKSFSQSQNLNSHQRIHTGEKPFQCTQCDKSFRLSSSLNRHQLVHTNVVIVD